MTETHALSQDPADGAPPEFGGVYAPLPRRYLATVVDGLLVLATFTVVSFLFQGAQESVAWIRVAIVLGLFFVYEPLLTSRRCTAGQRVMGVRVRDAANLERITIGAAYGRIIVKWLLGVISFVTIPFNSRRRGLHDFATGTVVIDAREAEAEPTP